MLLSHSWKKGWLKRRYKRFLADIMLESGEAITAHCPNTGGMRGLLHEGSEVYVSYNPSPKRKYSYTWESTVQAGTMIGVNTHLPNKLVKRALEERLIPELLPYTQITAETGPSKDTRFDFFLSGNERPCYVEVKNVHYREGLCALFPDSPTIRGQKHVRCLGDMVAQGYRAVLLYMVQRNDCQSFSFQQPFDPLYAARAEEALKKGVEMYAYSVTLTPAGASLGERLSLKEI